jgi:hypothetical protein
MSAKHKLDLHQSQGRDQAGGYLRRTIHTQQTRKAVCQLTALAPATARVAATAPRSRSHRSGPRRRDREPVAISRDFIRTAPR